MQMDETDKNGNAWYLSVGIYQLYTIQNLKPVETKELTCVQRDNTY